MPIGCTLILNPHIHALLGQAVTITYDTYICRLHLGSNGVLSWTKTDARGDFIHGVGKYMLIALSERLMWLAIEEGEGVQVSYFIDVISQRAGVAYWVGRSRPSFQEGRALSGAGQYQALCT